jgi:Kelch motif
MIRYIFSTSARPVFCCQDPLQLIRTSSIPVSREWTCVLVDGAGPAGPCGRYYHTMTLVGSKLFVFGGWSGTRCLNDIWALDLNYCTLAPRFAEPF